MKMKIKLLDISKTEIGSVDLPAQFHEEIRPDLIKRAVHAVESAGRQAYGADPLAGKRPSADTSKRRRHYRGTYGIGISRVPRKVMSRSGTRFNFVGAFAPGIVGGRRAHPPKSEKVLADKINVKERRKAIRSALAASVSKDTVAKRGHKVPESYPFAVSSKMEDIKKTSDFSKMLDKLGFGPELLRTSERKVRAGKGKSRGRKYKQKSGLLVVVSKSCSAQKAAKNIPGVDVAVIDRINAKLLAPGAQPGRITLYSEDAIKRLDSEKLFYALKTPKKQTERPSKEAKKADAKKAAPKKAAKKAAKKQ